MERDQMLDELLPYMHVLVGGMHRSAVEDPESAGNAIRALATILGAIDRGFTLTLTTPLGELSEAGMRILVAYLETQADS